MFILGLAFSEDYCPDIRLYLDGEEVEIVHRSVDNNAFAVVKKYFFNKFARSRDMLIDDFERYDFSEVYECGVKSEQVAWLQKQLKLRQRVRRGLCVEELIVGCCWDCGCELRRDEVYKGNQIQTCMWCSLDNAPTGCT